MELLDKFSAVEVKADNRISQSDLFYCEQHQSAYETAISSFKELAFFWDDIEAAQKELLGDRDSSSFYHNYLASRNGPNISKESIERHIASLHIDFIMTLTRHFNSCYHITVDSSEITTALLPVKPEGYGVSREMKEKYHKQMQNLTVHYQDVVDQIILRLNGRTFAEQAFYELYTECHNAAWNSYKNKAEFERRKDTIVFSGYFCRFKERPYDHWEVDDNMKKILRGAAHYETDSYRVLPADFSSLFNYSYIKESVVEFPNCIKIKQMKLFKNNRVDLKFDSPEYAEQFVAKYLGTVC